jgi:hypothetical protein
VVTSDTIEGVLREADLRVPRRRFSDVLRMGDASRDATGVANGSTGGW